MENGNDNKGEEPAELYSIMEKLTSKLDKGKVYEQQDPKIDVYGWNVVEWIFLI